MEQKQRIGQKVAVVAVILFGLLTLLSGAVQASAPDALISGGKLAKIDKIAPEVQQAVLKLPAGEMTTVIVTLKAQANVSAINGQDRGQRNEHVINALQNMADATQKRIIALLQARSGEGKVDQFTSYWVFNGLAVTATADVVAELAALPEVDTITPNSTLQEPAPQTASGPPEPNLLLIKAPALWNLGLQGQGIVVANMDTGVDVTHPDLSAQWRGGTTVGSILMASTQPRWISMDTGPGQWERWSGATPAARLSGLPRKRSGLPSKSLTIKVQQRWPAFTPAINGCSIRTATRPRMTALTLSITRGRIKPQAAILNFSSISSPCEPWVFCRSLPPGISVRATAPAPARPITRKHLP